MKSKKLISLLCAAALSASSFAALTVPASAADTVLYSNNFDGYTVNRALAVPYSAQAGWQDAANGGNTKFQDLLAWNTPTKYKLVEEAGKYLDEEGDYVWESTDEVKGLDSVPGVSIVCGTSNDDDTCAVYVFAKEEGGDDLYMSIPKGRFGKQGNTVLDGFDEFTANEGEDLVISYKMMMTLDGTDRSDQTIVTSFSTNASYSYTADVEGVWQDVRIVKGADGTNTVTVGETQAYSGSDDITGMTVVMPSGGDKAGNGHYPLVNIDDIVIMSAAAGTGATVTVPEAETIMDTASFGGEVVVATPVPDSTAPYFTAPADTTVSLEANFNSDARTQWKLGETAQEITDIAGMKINIGGRANTNDGTYAAIEQNVDDQVLTLVGNQYSTAGRGPVVTLDDNLDISADTSKTAVMAFATRLKSGSKNGAGRLYIMKDTTQTGDDGNGTYRNVMAVLTTDGTGSTFVRGEDTSEVIGIDVTADEWHVVTVMVSDAKYRVFVDGEQKIDEEYVSYGSNASKATALPVLAVTSASGDGSATYSVAKIDNILTYTGVLGEKAAALLPVIAEAPTPAPPTPTPIPQHDVTITYDAATKTASVATEETEAFPGVLIQAKYDKEGRLLSTKSYDLETISAAAAATQVVDEMADGDKLMVWNSLSGMVPYGVTTVADTGVAQPTEVPATEAPVEPTGTPEAGESTAAPTGTPEAGESTAAPTGTPEAGESTAAPTGTPEAGESTTAPTTEPTTEPTVAPTATPVPKYAVTVTTPENGTVTASAAEAEEGTEITLTVKPNLGYKLDTLTVTDADNANVTVENNKFTMPAKAVTVTATFAAKDVVPYADGTVTYDAEGDTKLFSEMGRVTGTIETAAATNTTKVEQLVGNGGKPRAKYIPYASYPMTGEAIKTTFDVTFPARVTYINILGADPGDAGAMDDGNAVTNKIATIGAETNTNVLCVYEGTTKVDIAGTNATTQWYHVEAVSNVTTKKVALKIYNYQPSNNYEGDTPVYDKELDFRDTNMTGFVGLSLYGTSNGSKMQLDNLYINDPSYVTPSAVTVTAPAETDGTLNVDKPLAALGDTVTITATAKAGRKVTGVTVSKAEGTVEVTPGENGTYTFVMPNEAVTVAATYDRADIASVEITDGPETVANGTTNTYKAVVKAADGTELTLTGEESITWTIAGVAETDVIAEGTAFAENVLSVDLTQADANGVITATLTGTEIKNTMNVTLVNAPVYTITDATELTGGSVASSTGTTIEGATVTVTVTPATGYKIDAVTYTPAVAEGADPATPVAITVNEGVYSFAMPAADVTVSAAFSKIDYALTPATVEGGTISFTVNDVAATTAQIGDTVVVVGTPEEGKELVSISVAPTNTESTNTVTVSGTSFTMIGEPVTVTAVFDTEIPKYMEYAEGKIKAVSVTAGSADSTYGQLKRAEYTSTSGDGGTEGIYTDGGFASPLLYTDGLLLTSYSKVSGGKLGTSTGTVTVFTVDGSTLVANNNVTLGFDVQCVIKSKNADISVAKLTSENPTDIGAMTYNAMNAMSATTIKSRVENGKNAKATVSFDITDSLNSDGVTYYAVYTETAREMNLSNFTLTATPIYDANVTVTDGANPLAGATVTLKSGDTTVATATSAETTGIAAFTRIPAGTYTVVVEKEGYISVEDGSITVAAEGANTANIALEENTAAPATLKVVYTTDGAETGKIAEAVVYGEDADKFEGDEVTVPVTALIDQKKYDEATKLYTVYKYTSGGTTAVTLTAGENTEYVTVTEDATKYNVYEQFEDADALLFTADSRMAVESAFDETLQSNVVKFRNANNAQNGYGFAHYSFADTLSANTETVTVEFDLKLAGGDRSRVTIGSAAARGTTGGCGKNTYSNTGGMFEMGLDKNNDIINGATKTKGSHSDKWVHVKVVVDNTAKKVDYVITDSTGATAEVTGTDVAYVDATTEITDGCTQIDLFGYINNSENYIDNLKVSSTVAAE